jgi:OmpA-OmpF porin, OOP family
MKKNTGLLATLGLCLAAFSFGANAQGVGGIDTSSAPPPEDEGGEAADQGSSDRRIYVSPMGSYTFTDDDRNTHNGFGGTIAVGKRMTSGLTLELTGFYTSMEADDGAQTATLTGVGIGSMIFPFSPSGMLAQAYLLADLHKGQGEDHPTTPNSLNFSYQTTVFDTGIGYVLPLQQWVWGYDMALRTEARYRYDAHTRTSAGAGGKKDFYDGVINVGLIIPLGKLPVQAAEQSVEVVQPADADGDGVPDDRDQCPDTPAGTTVNEQGCEGDTDADGVIDRLDSCPDTPAGTAVNEQGCPAIGDKDGDGVPDDKDQCPDSAAGSTVDENGCEPKPAESGCRAPAPGEPINLEGCATGESVVLKGVNFEVNSARLTANAKVILNQVADSLSANPALKVEIGGHTDSQGSDAFNQKLSERRANSVKDYLVARGIDSGRLSTKGYGESQPVDTNETPEGRELNRRVEMKVLEGGSAQ